MRELRLRRLDLLLPALIAVVGAVEILAAGYQPGWLGLATFLLAAAVLAFARPAPLAVPPVVAGIFAVTPLLGFNVAHPSSWVPLLSLAGFGAGLHAPRSRWPAGLACVLLALLVSTAGLDWFTDFEPMLPVAVSQLAGRTAELFLCPCQERASADRQVRVSVLPAVPAGASWTGTQVSSQVSQIGASSPHSKCSTSRLAVVVHPTAW